MNKQELLNTNNITKIQKMLKECLNNGKDAIQPCIEFFSIPKEYRSDKAIEMVVMVLQSLTPFIAFLNIAYENDLMQVLHDFAKNSYSKHITKETVLIRAGDVEKAFYLILHGKAIELSVHIEKKFLTKQEYISHLIKLHLLKEKKLFKDTIQLNKHFFPSLTQNISEWKFQLELNINLTELTQTISQFIKESQLPYIDIIQPQTSNVNNILNNNHNNGTCCYDIKSKIRNMKYLFQIPLYHTQHVLKSGDVIGSLIRTKLCKAQSTYVINAGDVVCVNKFDSNQYITHLFDIISENTKLQCESIYHSFYVFQDIPLDTFKHEIAKYFSYKQVKKGDYIIKQDSYSDNVYFILTGTFSITSYRSFKEVNQLIADLQNSLDNFNTNQFISSYMNKSQTKRIVHNAFECESYSSNPIYKSFTFTNKSKERKDILIHKNTKRNIFGLNDFYHKNNELYHFNVKCVSDNGGDMFYMSKDIFNSIMKRYRSIMEKCGKLIEERIRYYTLQLNKYKEEFIKNVENVCNKGITKGKWCLKKTNCGNIRLSMLNVHKPYRSVSGVTCVNYSCNNTNQSLVGNSVYDGSFEKKRSLGKNNSTVSLSTMYGSTSCLYDKKWLNKNKEIMFRPSSQRHFVLVNHNILSSSKFRNNVFQQLNRSGNKGSVSLRERNISQINFNI